MKTEKPNGKKVLVVAYNYILNDPPERQAAESLAKAGYETAVLQSPPQRVFPSQPPPGVRVVEYDCPTQWGGFSSLLRFLNFRKSLLDEIRSFDPDVVVTFMLHSLAALPQKGRRFKNVACIYDLPSLVENGRLDRWIFKVAWKHLKGAEVVWGSDRLKAGWAQRLAGLGQMPVVCHNCPPLSYMKDPLWPRDPWLRKELIQQGASLPARSGGNILLRAGGVGEYGGLEETLEAMTRLPKDYVYLMLGRPQADYLKKLKDLIQRMNLGKRAFVWDKASDEVWKKALRGADIGQMIHLPPVDKSAKEIYELNSGLSYNRTYLYMAAALPVISLEDPRLSPLYREVGNFRPARLGHLAKDIEKIWGELGRSKALRKKMGLKGRQAHLKKYSWEKQFGPLLQTIKSWDKSGKRP
ncbi:MAG TPA: glycosyltransferase [bacterium]|jgi:hypothetical protein|nr:glycosyltransferase [bacterium]